MLKQIEGSRAVAEAVLAATLLVAWNLFLLTMVIYGH